MNTCARFASWCEAVGHPASKELLAVWLGLHPGVTIDALTDQEAQELLTLLTLENLVRRGLVRRLPDGMYEVTEVAR
jgi:hypothetical protein